LRGVPPDHTQISVGDRLTGDKPVHRVLVTRVAELHHDIVGHLGQPRISQQQLQRIVMVLQAVQLPDTDQPVPGEGVQHHAAQFGRPRPQAHAHPPCRPRAGRPPRLPPTQPRPYPSSLTVR